MNSLYWVALIVVGMFVVAVRVLYSVGVGATLVGLLSAVARTLSLSSPLLLALFLLGLIAVCASAVLALAGSRSKP
jgi:hypothetical protein